MSEEAVSPQKVLESIRAHVPDECLEHMIFIGSLAVGYYYFRGQNTMVVRTKDADSLLSPRSHALSTAKNVTEKLFKDNWEFRATEEWSAPGNQTVPDDKLPSVRLNPPTTTDWFLELLAVPPTTKERTRQWTRLETRYGHFGLCSFGFLSLAAFKPVKTGIGLYVARPEMMALANLFEHPSIDDETMSGGFAGMGDVKRSNKDLGRVLAIARLAIHQNNEALEGWVTPWIEAVRELFPDEANSLAVRVDSGLQALLANKLDLQQALHTCNNGLLNSMPMTITQFEITAQQLLEFTVTPFKEAFE